MSGEWLAKSSESQEKGTMTTPGICKLCTLEKDPQDSHFIGKAVYKKLMEPSIRNPQPIVITSKNFKQSPLQLRDDVFWFDCEQIFNSGGELCRWFFGTGHG